MSLSVTDLACLRADHLVFENLSFQLVPGQALWVKGRNGAGKSSLLRVCARLLKPANGQVLWKDRNVHTDPDDYLGHYHYLGHLDALKPILTVRENLSFWANFHGRADLDKAYRDFDLTGLANTKVEFLSAGQKKRVSLARLTASPSALWILDEPVSSLDTDYIDLFRARLIEHLGAGGLALFATHQDLGLPNAMVLDLDKAAAE